MPAEFAGRPFASSTAETQWSALLSSLIRLRPFSERDTYRRGFNRDALLTEALERQRLFIESQHYSCLPVGDEPAEGRTLALRCINDPLVGKLYMTLLGKVSAGSPEAARQAALHYWLELCSTIPYDYELLPITRPEDFQRLAGWQLLEDAVSPESIAEVKRLEARVSTGQNFFYLLGEWKLSPIANEQVWRVLAGAQQRLMLDVLLRPTILNEEELACLKEIGDYLSIVANENSLITVQPYAAFAADHYANLTKYLRRPYLVQLRLVAPDGLPEYVPRTIGFTLAHSAEREAAMPSFEVIRPRDKTELTSWKDHLRYLEPDPAASQIVDQRFIRLRRMVDAVEAHALFRLPYPLGDEIPEVHFATTLES